MRFLKNLSVTNKLLLTVLMPFLGLLVLSIVVIQASYNKQSNSAKVVQLTDYVAQASLLMHELQKERGMTAGFIGSGGEKFSSALKQQRALTDQALENFNTNFQASERLQAIAPLMAAEESVINQTRGLSNIRQRVTGLSIATAEAIGFYTQINHALLKSVGEITHFTSEQQASISYASYTSFLQAKERAGIERAVLANAFAKNQMPAKQFQRFLQLKVEQNTYLDVFLVLTNDSTRAYYQSQLTPSLIQSVERYRSIAEQGATGQAMDASAESWFAAATKRINALKKVDEYIAQENRALAHTQVEKSFVHMLIVSIGSVVSMLFCIAMSSWVIGNIKRSVASATDAAERIAQGDFSGQIEIDSRDEIGQLLASFQIMQQNLEANHIRDKEQSDKFARVKFALDSLSLSVMVADEDHNIIYTNQAILDMFRAAEADIRKDMPGFSADKILGANIDIFHKNPAHQRSMLKGMSGALKSALTLGGTHLAFTANKVVNADGEFIGTVVEWADRTQQVNTERDLEKIVSAAIAGDLSQRTETRGKEGFFLTMASSINDTLDVVASVMGEVERTMSSLSAGDLRNTIEHEYQGIYNDVKNNINTTVSTLESVVSRIQRASGQIDSGSNEIDRGNTHLAERTEEQVSNIEETATAVEELTASVQQNAQNAKYANDLADKAATTAKDGGEVIERVIGAIEDINQSSGKIVEIISVIDEIAFQTNLLALNAAVEAARAGEQGRGFAVVADEVQRLAQRSASAAQEIQNLIQDSVQKVKTGTSLASTSGDTLAEIVKSIQGVSSVVSDISSAVQEQAVGIEQVNSSIARLDAMTQQNASLAQQTSVVSSTMLQSTREMRELMGHFTLKNQAA